MVRLGAEHDMQAIRNAFADIVSQLDDVKKACEAVAQWAQLQEKTALGAEWNCTPEDAQAFIDAANIFGAMVGNALAADAKLGPLVASIRKIGS